MSNAIKLSPIIKSYIWGGQYFQSFGKGNQDIISELWELSIRDDDSVYVFNTNKRLIDVLAKEDFGPNCERFPYFPVLIKLIDAKENLSIQVHPSDDYALKNEGSFGKSEMWYILDADEGSGLYVGFKEDYSKEEIANRLNNGTITEVLNFFEVKKGDSFIIDPGTVHAIGKGVRIIEIQQNSNLTYRLFDYFRKDKDGNFRELHIEKALKVIDFCKYNPEKCQENYIANNEYFKVKKIDFDGEIVVNAYEGSFVSFTCIEGEGKVDGQDLKTFDTFFLPYNKSCKIKGKGTLIVTSV